MLERKTVSRCPTSDYCKGWNDAVAEMPKWISVEDRFPEHNVRVLFGYAKEGFVAIGYLDREEMDWCDDCDIQVKRPSHWMPLPEPPKEDGA